MENVLHAIGTDPEGLQAAHGLVGQRVNHAGRTWLLVKSEISDSTLDGSKSCRYFLEGVVDAWCSVPRELAEILPGATITPPAAASASRAAAPTA